MILRMHVLCAMTAPGNGSILGGLAHRWRPWANSLDQPWLKTGRPVQTRFPWLRWAVPKKTDKLRAGCPVCAKARLKGSMARFRMHAKGTSLHRRHRNTQQPPQHLAALSTSNTKPRTPYAAMLRAGWGHYRRAQGSKLPGCSNACRHATRLILFLMGRCHPCPPALKDGGGCTLHWYMHGWCQATPLGVDRSLRCQLAMRARASCHGAHPTRPGTR